ncbi:hypothetical protein [Sorangium sp. So ce381]|uniref:hypothetical protein n=1 Tax=Sorangium sp. So ce381 TaxID=3133307 RepID=UPI003F5B9369
MFVNRSAVGELRAGAELADGRPALPWWTSNGDALDSSRCTSSPTHDRAELGEAGRGAVQRRHGRAEGRRSSGASPPGEGHFLQVEAQRELGALAGRRSTNSGPSPASSSSARSAPRPGVVLLELCAAVQPAAITPAASSWSSTCR